MKEKTSRSITGKPTDNRLKIKSNTNDAQPGKVLRRSYFHGKIRAAVTLLDRSRCIPLAIHAAPARLHPLPGHPLRIYRQHERRTAGSTSPPVAPIPRPCGRPEGATSGTSHRKHPFSAPSHASSPLRTQRHDAGKPQGTVIIAPARRSEPRRTTQNSGNTLPCSRLPISAELRRFPLMGRTARQPDYSSLAADSFTSPRDTSNGRRLGCRPRKFSYSTIPSAVPPLESISSRKRVATFLLKISPVSRNASYASLSSTPAQR